MNLNFNKKPQKSGDAIKLQISQYKLRVDEPKRYLTNFDVFQDDNIIMCYVDEKELEISYKDMKVVNVDYYENEAITMELFDLIDEKYSIYETLIMFNDYFESIESDEEEEEESVPIHQTPSVRRSRGSSESTSNVPIIPIKPVSYKLSSLIEDDDDTDDAIFEKLDSETSDEEENVKDVKPAKFEFDIVPKHIIDDLSDDIILSDNTTEVNYIPYEIINNSKKRGSNLTIHLIVNELNKIIKSVKNIIIKPIETIFEISVENKFNDEIFNYTINIPSKYPYVPPSIVVKSVYNQSFTYALNNCEILNESKWNPSITLYDIVFGIYSNIEKLDINELKSNIKDKKFYDLTSNLLKLTNTEPLNAKKFNLNFDFLKIQDKPVSKGIGYDFTGDKWDVNTYLKSEEEKNNKITSLLSELIPIISTNSDFISDTCLIPYIRQYIYDVSIMEVDKKKAYYERLFEAFNEIYKLVKYNEHFNIEKISEQRELFTEYPTIYKNIPILEKKSTEVDKLDYVSVMRELAFGSCEIVKLSKFKFMEQTKAKSADAMFMKRVSSELKNLHKNLPISETSSIFLRTDESNTSIMKFLIIPHPDTPYAYGCFEFDMYLPYNYPSSPPHTEIITTGGGTFRFNPNLYDSGKVCLSLLGTWSGSGGESWTPNSTILQVLLSIQSLIFCEEPYFNEPGYERDRGNAKGAEANNKYNEPVRLNTMKLAMLEQLKNPSFGFGEVIKNHFRLKKNDIYKKLDDWEKISSNKTNFKKYYDELKGIVDKL